MGDGPIIEAATHPSIGTNIQGPSLIRVPDWVPEPLGRYYLYFADHKGSHIRLAYADRVAGPWTVHPSGSLQLAESCFLTEAPAYTDDELARLRERWLSFFGGEYDLDEILADAITPHIASPDVHVDDDQQRFVMYFHGLESLGKQVTRVATSADGVSFAAQSEVLGSSYFRVFRYDGWHYALVMPGLFMRSADGLTAFEQGPRLFEPAMRHSAVLVEGDTLHVWWSRAGDAPESILHSTIDLRGDWMHWSPSPEQVVLAPELDWEGAAEPVVASRRGAINSLVNQLRDPAILVDDDETWMLYAAGGESCIGLATIAR